MKDMRTEYQAQPLHQQDLLANPLAQAKRWIDDAINADLPLANAMTLATANAHAEPSARIVLLKEIDATGLVFFTHYDSQKGLEIAANPQVALVMFWQAFDRQLSIKGKIEKVSITESEDYFASRPYESQLSAAISPQSQPASREWLEKERSNMAARYPEAPLPRPKQWGGYRVIPEEIQFWHGRPSRLHDRFRYLRVNDKNWKLERLAP